MVQIDWKNGESGDWGNAANWSGGVIPNSTTADVTIAVAGTYAATLAAAENFTVGSFTFANGNANFDLLGTLDLSGGLGSATVNGGTFILGRTGELTGESLNFNTGTFIADGGTLATTANYFGAAATIQLDGNVLTLPGTSTLGAVISGNNAPGSTLVVTGNDTPLNEGTIFANFNEVINDATLIDAGTITLSTALALGEQVGDSSDLIIDRGAVFDIVGEENGLDESGSGSILNAGLIEGSIPGDVGHDEAVYIDAPLYNTGTIVADAGTDLIVQTDIGYGFSGSSGGTLAGAGRIDFGDGLFTGNFVFNPGLVVTVATLGIDGVTLGADLDLTDTVDVSGSVSLEGHNLTLAGNSAIFSTPAGDPRYAPPALPALFLGQSEAGTGNMVLVSGTASDQNGIVADDATLVDSGLINQIYASTLGLSASDTSSLSITSSGTYNLDGPGPGDYLYMGNGPPYTVISQPDNEIDSFGTGSISNAGLFEVTGVAGVATVYPSFVNTGTVLVTPGTTLNLAGNIGNYANGALTGGTWEVSGPNALLQFYQDVPEITTDAADIILSGTGSEIDTGAPSSIEASLTSITTAGTLQNIGGRTYSTPGTLTDSGLIVLSGSFAAAELNLFGSVIAGAYVGGEIEGSGTLSGPVVMKSGTILATGGTLTVTGPIAGYPNRYDDGDINIASGSKLVLENSLSGALTLVFAGAGGTLALPDASQFYAPTYASGTHYSPAELDGISVGDVLELPGTAVLGASFGVDTLGVTTSSGIYDFGAVTYGDPVNSYTVTKDAATGLEAITFTNTITEPAALAIHGPATYGIVAANNDSIRGLSITEGTAVAGETFRVELYDGHGLLTTIDSNPLQKVITLSGSYQFISDNLASLKDLDTTGGADRIIVTATDSLEKGPGYTSFTIAINADPEIFDGGSDDIGINNPITQNLTVGTVGAEFIDSGVTAINTTVDGAQYIYGGNPDLGLLDGKTEYTVLRGDQYVTGGNAFNTQIEKGGTQFVWAFGDAIGSTIFEGGLETVQSMGRIIGATLTYDADLKIDAGAAAYGTISFGGSDASFSIGGTVMPSAVISGFDQNNRHSDLIYLDGFTYAAGDTATLGTGNILTLDLSGQIEKIAFSPSDKYTNEHFVIGTDAAGKVVIEIGAGPGMNFISPALAGGTRGTVPITGSNANLPDITESSFTSPAVKTALNFAATGTLSSPAASSLTVVNQPTGILSVTKLVTHAA